MSRINLSCVYCGGWGFCLSDERKVTKSQSFTSLLLSCKYLQCLVIPCLGCGVRGTTHHFHPPSFHLLIAFPVAKIYLCFLSLHDYFALYLPFGFAILALCVSHLTYCVCLLEREPGDGAFPAFLFPTAPGAGAPMRMGHGPKARALWPCTGGTEHRVWEAPVVA